MYSYAYICVGATRWSYTNSSNVYSANDNNTKVSRTKLLSFYISQKMVPWCWRDLVSKSICDFNEIPEICLYLYRSYRIWNICGVVTRIEGTTIL